MFSCLVQTLDPVSFLVSQLQKWRIEPKFEYTDNQPWICTISVGEEVVRSGSHEKKRMAKQEAASRFLQDHPGYVKAPLSPSREHSWDTLLHHHKVQHLVNECSSSFQEKDLAEVRQCPMVVVDCEGVICPSTRKVSLAVISLYAGGRAWVLSTSGTAEDKKARLRSLFAAEVPKVFCDFGSDKRMLDPFLGDCTFRCDADIQPMSDSVYGRLAWTHRRSLVEIYQCVTGAEGWFKPADQTCSAWGENSFSEKQLSYDIADVFATGWCYERLQLKSRRVG